MPPAKDPHRRQETEDWLDNHSVSWEYVPALELSRIDIERSLQNQAKTRGSLVLPQLAFQSLLVLSQPVFWFQG